MGLERNKMLNDVKSHTLSILNGLLQTRDQHSDEKVKDIEVALDQMLAAQLLGIEQVLNQSVQNVLNNGDQDCPGQR